MLLPTFGNTFSARMLHPNWRGYFMSRPSARLRRATARSASILADTSGLRYEQAEPLMKRELVITAVNETLISGQLAF